LTQGALTKRGKIKILNQPYFTSLTATVARAQILVIASSLTVLSLLLVASANAQLSTPSPSEQLKLAEQAVQDTPRDAKKRFELAEALRKSGELHKASIQYLDLTVLDPGYYVAYHQLISTKPSNDQLDEAIERLNKLKEQHPDELMLRVALSEVLEQRGEIYKAARALVDLQLANGVSSKYAIKINARVRYLLSKAKDMHTAEKAQQAVRPATEDLDSVPIPIPDTGSDKDLSTAKLKNATVPEGYGHAKLLP
jgi:tetratricopeptide (TPR) repeat protein